MSTHLTATIEARRRDVIPGGDDLVVEVTVPAYVPSGTDGVAELLPAVARQAVAQTIAAVNAAAESAAAELAELRPGDQGDSTA